MLETLLLITIIQSSQISTQSYIMTNPAACESIKAVILEKNKVKKTFMSNPVISYNVECFQSPRINNMDNFRKY